MSSTLREAAEQALEALERADKISGYSNNRKTITALHAALAEPVEYAVEPNGKRSPLLTHMMNKRTKEDTTLAEPEPATQPGPGLVMRPECCSQFAPPQRKPLRTVTYVCPVCAASLERQE